MIAGAMGKRFNYFMSAFMRLICFLGTLIAYIVVKITVNPPIEWLNILLLLLSIGGLISGIFNLIMCGMTATSYKEMKFVQIICLILTIVTGGLFGTIFTSLALAGKISQEEVDNEKLIRVRGKKNGK